MRDAAGDADTYFGKVLRSAKPSTRTGRAAALTVFLHFLELRHKVELHNLTGRVVECPLDEINRPRGSVEPQLRIPPTAGEIEQFPRRGGAEFDSQRLEELAGRFATVQARRRGCGLKAIVTTPASTAAIAATATTATAPNSQGRHAPKSNKVARWNMRQQWADAAPTLTGGLAPRTVSACRRPESRK
ncbi:hypothetical protein ACQP2U_24130 [Nocardia sp. CA-084685]|uniref:hypothetical protein n=1 Tax=Nocardia sp. CA-084685 TaxID=3239970 RepID=UPI003D997BD4